MRATVLQLGSLQVMRTRENNRLGVARDAVKPGIVSHIEWLDNEIKALAQKISEHMDGDANLKDKQTLPDSIPADSIPGLGERTIAILLAFYAGPDHFGGCCG